MKYRFFLILLLLCSIEVYSDSVYSLKDLNEFNSVNSFFGELEYDILQEQLILDDRKLTIGVHYIKKDQGIFDKAIIFEDSANGSISTHLIVWDGIIKNTEEIIVDVTCSIGFYGFDIFLSYPKNPGFDIGVGFVGYFDYGKSPADPPISIDWNPEEKIFYKFVLNWDEL